MTRDREALARALDNINVYPLSKDDAEQTQRAIDAAAAALRQTCAGCQHWSGVKWPDHGGHHRCMHAEVTYMPYDGSGFCHRWSAQP